MKKFLILYLFFLFILVFKSEGQRVEVQIENYKKSLTLSKIDIYLIYSFGCSRDIPPPYSDSCANEDPQYLIWKNSSNYYLKKFSFCDSFKIIEIDSLNPLTFYLSNIRNIDKEEIKPPTYYSSLKGKKITTNSRVSHSCYHRFEFHSKYKTKFKSADIYDLDFIKFDNGRKNVYYNYNQQSKLKSLIDQVTRLIKKLETTNKFEVIN